MLIESHPWLILGLRLLTCVQKEYIMLEPFFLGCMTLKRFLLLSAFTIVLIRNVLPEPGGPDISNVCSDPLRHQSICWIDLIYIMDNYQIEDMGLFDSQINLERSLQQSMRYKVTFISSTSSI